MSEALAILPYQGLAINQNPFQVSLFDRYIKYAGVKETTLKGYITCIHAFRAWMLQSGIVQPTRDDIEEYKSFLNESQLKAGTKAQYLRAVKHFFKWLSLEGLYPNIADGCKGNWKIDTLYHKRKCLEREAVPIVADSIDRATEAGKRLYAMFLLGVVDGLRTIELSRANVEDIQTIGNRTYLYVQGKGHDEKDSPVLLPAEVKKAIDQYLTARTDKPTGKSPLFVGTANNSKPGSIKFVTDKRTGIQREVVNDGRIAPTTISTMLKTMLKNAGYDSTTLTAHSLRHTSGTGAYLATKNLYLTQQHQRHKDPSTTEIYVHAEDRKERNTEELVFNYYFNQDAANNPQQEAISIIQNLPADKLEKALAVLRALR